MNRSFSKIWIIVILTAVLAGGFFAWQYWAPKPAPADETAGWETLEATANFNGGKPISYTVKYPKDWKVETNVSNNKSLSYILDGQKYGLYFLTGSGGVSWQFDQQKDEDITFNGKKFIKRSWIKDSKVIYISYIVEDYPAPFEAILAIVPTKDNQAYVDLYERIIDTLEYPVYKFTEMAYETTNWKTYRNEEYGFETKYPSLLEGGEPGCRISEIEDIIFIGPISLMFFNIQDLTLDEWINGEIAKVEEDTKEMQENAKRVGNEKWQGFGSKLLSREEIFIDGERAVKLSYQFIGAGFDLPITISVKKGDQIYDFRTNDANLVQEACAAKFGKKPSEFMELMLSTFRFSE